MIRKTRSSFTVLLLFFFYTASAQKQTVIIASPNGHLILSIFTVKEKLVYTLRAGSQAIFLNSPLGLVVDNKDLGQHAELKGNAIRTKINETYTISGNHSIAYNRANEVEIPITTAGSDYSVIARVYNDGIGIRYTLPVNSKYINGDHTTWVLPAELKKIAWADYSQSYEGINYSTSLNEVPEDKTIMAPVTFQTSQHFISITEADGETFSDMALIRNGHSLTAQFPFAKEGWEIKPAGDGNTLKGMYKGKNVSPWRSTIVARSLNELVNSDLITNLCPAPAAGSDFSWVKPGRSLWQWWSVGEPQYEDQKKWYDAAAKLKWEYYLVDDGWRTWNQPGKDQWMLLKEVIDYGKKVGVNSLVWVDSKEFRKAPERQAYLHRIKEVGAVGIKIDFIPDATAEIMQWYAETTKECADLKLMVNFHGSVKPTGLRRTYPNDITREAIRGNEYHMTKYNRVLPPQHNVTVPFTRFIAGAADFTSVILNPKELESTKFSWTNEFAQSIVYLSPITHFADQFQFYLDNPMFDLFQTVPTVWDETRVLPCSSIGDVVAFARRKGNIWWIGVMNGAAERTVTIPLDFLKKKSKATLIYDGANHTSVDRREQVLSAKDVLSIKLRTAGGFVAKIE